MSEFAPATAGDVLNYCSDEYNFIVLADQGGEEPSFWTLEKTEEDAQNRVANETAAYGGEDESPYKFYYRPLTRRKVKYHHKKEEITEVRIG